MIFGAFTAGAVLAQAPVEIKPSPLLAPGFVSNQPNPDALTPKEKLNLALRNTFGPRALGNRMLAASIDQWRDHPTEWESGVDGFSTRFASRMGRLAVRNSVRLATDVAFGIDPRYDRCDCAGFLKRTGHAWKRVIVSRSDSGGEMPALSNFTGAYVAPMITYTWYPDRLNTWDRKLQSGTLNLGMRGLSNMLREFWPDVKRGFRRN
jgi:hypothetical protein